MANPESASVIKPHFCKPLLPGFHDHLTVPVSFFMKHIEGRNDDTTVKLRSDVSHRTWEVKLNGRILTEGWRDFAVDHDFRVRDIIVFRLEGDMVFHVTGFGLSRCNLQYSPSSSFPDDGDDEKDNTDENKTSYVSRKKKKVNKNQRRTMTKSSRDYICFDVTASNLELDRRLIPLSFARPNCLNKRRCEVELLNQHGDSWTLDLRHHCIGRTDRQVYLRGGWRRFCRENGLKAGDLCTFKLVRNGTKPVFQLCLKDSRNNSFSRGEEGCSEANDNNSQSSTKYRCRGKRRRASSSPSGQDRFVTLTLSSNRQKTGQLSLPSSFTRSNGIEKSGEIILVDKSGEERPSYIRSVKGRCEWFYLRRGWREACEANGVSEGESFTLELIWRGSTPVLKFGSETQPELGDSDCDGARTAADQNARKRRTRETVQPPRTRKRARVRVPGPILDHPDQDNTSNSMLQSCPNDSRNNSGRSSDEGCSAANLSNRRSTKSRLRVKRSSRKRSRALRTQRASSQSGRNRFVTLSFTAHSHKTGTLSLPISFTEVNNIEEPGKVMLLDKSGVKRPSYIRLVKRPKGSFFYIRKNCRDFCKANGVKLGESFILELIREDTVPLLKFCSKTKRGHILRDNEDETESAYETMAEVNTPKRRTRRTIQEQDPIAATDTEAVTHKRSEKRREHRCRDGSASKASGDAMAKARQNIEDALTEVRQSREMLAEKEENLKASLNAFDALGCKECE